MVTPAHRNDGPLAIPMFAVLIWLYHLRIRVVRADAAYFNYAFLGFVRNVLHIQPGTAAVAAFGHQSCTNL